MRERSFAIRLYPLDQYLGTAAGFLAPMQARLDDFGVIENEDVVWRDQRGQIGKLPILNHAGIAINVQQTASRPLDGGMLRDQLLGQVVVEIGELHIAGDGRNAAKITL